ncbi:MAG: hypothetical protein J1F02_06700 [Lachnospiraceae bacterium]|nr:hypothetical protein [Lachnospiraceae bacterium]
MKEKVLSLAKGNFIYEAPALVVTPNRLEISVVAGEKKTETFSLVNERGTKVKGFGSTEAVELDFLPVFHGEENELKLEVDARELVPGETLQGEIHLVTDCGEASLPYHVSVVSPQLRDDRGVVRDYYALQERIQENPENGLKLFLDANFKEAFLYRDENSRILYRHLMKKNTKLRSMEEFLVAMGKKPAIRFEIVHEALNQDGEIAFELNGADIRGSLKVRVNTWGSTGIRVRSTVDFLEPDLHEMWTDEFVKGEGTLEFTVLADQVKEGRRFGSLVFESDYEIQEVPVSAHNQEGEQQRKVARAKKAAVAMLFRTYLAYKEGRLPKSEFQKMLRRSRSVIEKISTGYQLPLMGYIAVMLEDEKAILDFYQEAEPLTVPKISTEEEMPNHVPDREGLLREIENYILIEYDKFLYTDKEEERERISQLLESYSDNGYSSLPLFCLRLYTDDRYRSVRIREKEIREQLEQGMNSPLLYSEMLKVYLQEPALVTSLDRVTIGTINYGLKQDLISEDIAVRVSFLAERIPDIEPVILHVLEMLYEKFYMEDTLYSICSLLIRSELREPEYFSWFARGVQQHLRLTDLYEYYMYTMDTETAFSLPDSVLSYFQYENHLNDSCKAFLYAYIMSKREENPEQFRLYGNQIREFALEQISRKHISEDLSVIYEGLFQQENIPEAMISELPWVMFNRRLVCRNKKIDAVVVVHTEMKEEVYYSLKEGEAVVQIFTPNYQLYFMDQEGNYCTGTVDYTLQKFLNLEKYALTCYENGSEYTELLAYLAVEALKAPRLDEKKAEIMLKVAKMRCFRDYTNGKLLLRLYDYYKEKKDMAMILEVLDDIVPEAIKRERIGEVATDCIYHGMYDRAEKMLLRYGLAGCEKKALAMLLQEKIQKNGGEFSPVLVKWAFHLYQEHFYERGAMHYLLQYYMGSTGTLTDIYKKCLENPEITIDDGSKERLLGQVLFAEIDTAPYENLFLEYYQDGNNRVLVKAFLSAMAYEYIVGQLELSEEVFSKIEKEAYYEKETVMVLATLKYYSTRSEFTEKQKDFIELSLENCASEGRILTFMKEFVGKLAVPYEIENTVLLQYNSGTDKGVFLFVRNPEGKFEGQPMKRIFDGIFTQELLLFEGEEKTCYIYEEETDERTGDMVVRRPRDAGFSPGFFKQVNDMIQAKEQGETEQYDALRQQYEKERRMAAKLFSLQ